MGERLANGQFRSTSQVAVAVEAPRAPAAESTPGTPAILRQRVEGGVAAWPNITTSGQAQLQVDSWALMALALDRIATALEGKQ